MSMNGSPPGPVGDGGSGIRFGSCSCLGLGESGIDSETAMVFLVCFKLLTTRGLIEAPCLEDAERPHTGFEVSLGFSITIPFVRDS